MKKTLVIHCYVNYNIEYRKCLNCHFFYLKKYANIFDKIIFVVALDNLQDDELISYATQKAFEVFDSKKLIIKFIQNDKVLCEVPTFRDEVLNNESLEGLVFFCHTKGGHFNNHNTLKWNSCMYFYNFHFMDDVISKLENNNGIFYGTLLHQANNKEQVHNRNLALYSGAFYWVNIDNMRKRMKDDNNTLEYLKNDRYFAEFFPGEIVGIDEMNSLNNVSFRWLEIHTYFGDYDTIVHKLGYEKEFWEEYNNMYNEINYEQ